MPRNITHPGWDDSPLQVSFPVIGYCFSMQGEASKVRCLARGHLWNSMDSQITPNWLWVRHPNHSPNHSQSLVRKFAQYIWPVFILPLWESYSGQHSYTNSGVRKHFLMPGKKVLKNVWCVYLMCCRLKRHLFLSWKRQNLTWWLDAVSQVFGADKTGSLYCYTPWQCNELFEVTFNDQWYAVQHLPTLFL
jgi:hypothetical protein